MRRLYVALETQSKERIVVMSTGAGKPDVTAAGSQAHSKINLTNSSGRRGKGEKASASDILILSLVPSVRRADRKGCVTS
jgi:hypothetical protein